MASTAAAVSLTFVLVFGFLSRRLKWAQLVESMRETAYQTAALFFIAVRAKIFVPFVSLTGVTGALVEWVSVFGLENWTILLVVVLMYLVMGMFLDPLGTMLLTLPFVVPLVENMGFDLILDLVVLLLLLSFPILSLFLPYTMF